MKVTEVRIRLANERKLKAYVSITLESCLAVRNIRVIEGKEGRLFIAMPSERGKDGKHRDIAYPITTDCRQKLESSILASYEEAMRAAIEKRPSRPESADTEGVGVHPMEH